MFSLRGKLHQVLLGLVGAQMETRSTDNERGGVSRGGGMNWRQYCRGRW